MNLLRKLFERKYNTQKCYIIKLAEVIKIKKSSLYTPGYTEYNISPLLLTAKKTKDNKFTLLTSNVSVYSHHHQTKFKGDIFAAKVQPMGLFTSKKHMRRSELVEFEKTINKEIIAELEK